jgi:hypothetical protein
VVNTTVRPRGSGRQAEEETAAPALPRAVARSNQPTATQSKSGMVLGLS